MMTALYDNEVVIASKQLNKTNTYVCPECGEILTLKAGNIKIPHFAHKTGTNCLYYEYSKGESEEHKKYKLTVVEFLKTSKNIQNIQMEHRAIKDRIADIYFEHLNGQKFVVEIQHSKMSIDEFVLRTYDYSKNNISVMWIFDKKFITCQDENLKTISKNTFLRYLIFKDDISYFIDDNCVIYKGFTKVINSFKNTYAYDLIPLHNKDIFIKPSMYSYKINDKWYDLKFYGFNIKNYKNPSHEYYKSILEKKNCKKETTHKPSKGFSLDDLKKLLELRFISEDEYKERCAIINELNMV